MDRLGVQNGEYFAYRLNGMKLRIEFHDGSIRFTEDSDSASMETVRNRENAADKQTHHIDLDQLSTPELVQLAGFSL